MLALTITLAVVSIIFMVILGIQDDKDAALKAENSLLKNHLDALQECNLTSTGQTEASVEPLTAENISAAVRYSGYLPETDNNDIHFKVEEKNYTIDANRLPLVCVQSDYSVDTNSWNIEMLKKAAHILSDELVMVKALINEGNEMTTLRFLVVAMDRNYMSFRDNLPFYIHMLQQGSSQLAEFYHTLEEEKKSPAQLARQITSFRYDA